MPNNSHVANADQLVQKKFSGIEVLLVDICLVGNITADLTNALNGHYIYCAITTMYVSSK